MSDSTPLDERLIESGLLTRQQLDEVRWSARNSERSIWAELVRSGLLNQEQLACFFGAQLSVPYVDLSAYRLGLNLSQYVPEHLAREFLAAPLFEVEGTLYVAMANPLNLSALDEIRRSSQLDVEAVIASGRQVFSALDAIYGSPGPPLDAFSYYEGSVAPGSPQTRESTRVPFVNPATLEFTDHSIRLITDGPVQAYTEDLSAKGVSVRTAVFLPKGTPVKVTLDLAAQRDWGGPAPVCAMARVAHASRSFPAKDGSDPYVLGVEFLDLDSETAQALDRWVNARSQT
ncbi:MAG: PilZ domain-containing protein [Candidatus Omnitrophica bacterium]|nr:PilZ domain-containing protein [Candidatus Omnitrophota bacterium]